MEQADLVRVGLRRIGGVRVAEDVDRVEVIAQGHEDAAVLGVLFGDVEAEDVAVEVAGALLVDDTERDVADAFDFHISVFPFEMRPGSRARMLAPPRCVVNLTPTPLHSGWRGELSRRS